MLLVNGQGSESGKLTRKKIRSEKSEESRRKQYLEIPN